MHNIPGGMGEAVMPHTIFEDPPPDDDIILVTKHLLASQSYAQDPEVFCPGVRLRALPAEGPGIISGRVQLSARQHKEFIKTADVVTKSPWNMHRSGDWLKAIVATNRSGFSPDWVPPVISWVVSGDQVGRHPLPPMPRALPYATPVAVAMEDVSKRRIKRKRACSEVLAPAAQKSQRDQNLAAPSAAQSIAGAPPPMVNEAGAPANVAAPRVQPAVAVAVPSCTTPYNPYSLRFLLAITTEPSLGCGKCRQSPAGCKGCRKKRDLWRMVHGREVLP